jgi:hypothetical protein
LPPTAARAARHGNVRGWEPAPIGGPTGPGAKQPDLADAGTGGFRVCDGDEQTFAGGPRREPAWCLPPRLPAQIAQAMAVVHKRSRPLAGADQIEP